MNKELNQKRIEQLRNGEVILENDDREKCKKIMSFAFEDIKGYAGSNTFYFACNILKQRWMGTGHFKNELTELIERHPTSWFFESEPAIVDKPSLTQAPFNTPPPESMEAAPKEIDWSTIPVGTPFRCKIQGDDCEGKVQKRDGKIFLCQSVKDGGHSKLEKLGYPFAWGLYCGMNYKYYQVTDLELFPEPQGKFLGYVCPMDLFGGEIKKGELFMKIAETDKGYFPESDIENDYYYLPAEIVETWQKAYEQVPKEIAHTVICSNNGIKLSVKITRDGVIIFPASDLLHWKIPITELQNIIDKAKLL